MPLGGQSTPPDYGFERAPERAGSATRAHFSFTHLIGFPNIHWLRAIKGNVGMQRFSRFIQDDSGQEVVEYGLLIATIAIVVLIGVGIFGGAINTWFQSLAGRITTVGT